MRFQGQFLGYQIANGNWQVFGQGAVFQTNAAQMLKLQAASRFIQPCQGLLEAACLPCLNWSGAAGKATLL
jgi:hypothetical protein